MQETRTTNYDHGKLDINHTCFNKKVYASCAAAKKWWLKEEYKFQNVYFVCNYCMLLV